ncbi:hypothetical protein ACWGQ5_56245 [Streptomyces sp. NPDC055722]
MPHLPDSVDAWLAHERRAIGDRIRVRRLHDNRTQESAFLAARVSRSTYQAIEAGAADARILAGSVIRRAWGSAREAVLPPHVFESPTGRRVYDNRHTRLTKWLNDGVPPARVAEWAGNNVPVLLATYARCVDGQLSDLKKRLEAAGDLPELPGGG